MTVHYDIIHGDCLEVLPTLPNESVSLVATDPPYNIGIDYGEGSKADLLSADDYRDFTLEWTSAMRRKLTKEGSLVVLIGNEYATMLERAAIDMGFHLRQRIVWHYNFGVHCETKFGRNHTPILYFTKNKSRFTFNADAIRVPSDRQTKYGDPRANPNGRVPGDVWHIPRVCGTHKERLGWHPTQMPLAIAKRLILALSNEGDTVLDPFMGSCTTGVMAARLGRRYIGIDINKEYCEKSWIRISNPEPQPIIEDVPGQKMLFEDEKT